ncbi:MerR family transcriptional regulator [Lactobacillus sp. PV037]|uniref:MerR family transcriptional regulator n=1 Tax=unclassified Lactobacillus TaxID=2620435 RepID=UPI00223EC9EF|nr:MULTISPECIES: MerR family transcriptional regulator [unclassified Lactobacillus]QNQ81971.1 MerR family transcriptional regulator [Lactobacillus sp. PV012]QNQ83994.1 MerR family transcriptional regulator [Lactobacillus sp. PV037]
MNYSIKECSQKTNLSSYTLRYYEKEGLITNIERDHLGQRSYNDQDIELIKSIDCLKKAGMSIKKIKSYMKIFQTDNNEEARIKLFKQQKEILKKKMEELQEEMWWADYKIWYYQNLGKLVSKSDPLHCEKMEKFYRRQEKKREQ